MTVLEMTPLTPKFGVEIKEVDLCSLNETGLYPQIRAAFEEHSALLFKEQDLTPEDHIKLARLFGPLENRKNEDPNDLSEGDDFVVPPISNVT